MKKSILLLLVAAMLLSCFLTACSTETPAATPTTPDTTEEPKAPAEEPTETPAEPTTEPEPTEEPTEEPAENQPYHLNVADEKIVTVREAGGITWEMPPVAKGAGATVLPLSETGETLSVYRQHITFDHSITSPEEIKANILLEEKTGVDIDWQLYTSSEQFNLMIVSEDYADMIWCNTKAYTGGVDKAIEDEVYVNAANYFELTPNYVQLLERDKEIARNAATDTHNYFFTTINSGVQGSFGGSLLRKDWLDDVGLDMPVTYDDWYEMLVAFRDQKGATDALYISPSVADAPLTAGYETYAGFYAKNGTEARYGYIDEGMRDFVTMMNRWYSEGLVYRDFAINTDISAVVGQCASQATGATSDGYFGYVDIFKGMIPGSQFVGVTQPQRTEDQGRLHFRGATNLITSDSNIFITTAAVARGVDELVAKWIDYRYSEEGSIILYYGVEGESFYFAEDGFPHVTEAIIKNEFNGVVYEDMGSVWTESSTVHGTYAWLIKSTDTKSAESMAPIAVWSSTADVDWHMPTVSMTSEEAELYRQIYGDIETYVKESFSKFIIGDLPLSEWDNYVATIEQMGIQDCIDCYQAALDRYNAR